MTQYQPKYSIIIPTKNGGKYLPTCVNSIINQDYYDFELIISDDHSTDGSKEYLTTLSSHPNITIITPKKTLSMAEHWEWALSHAHGEWLIFVGQDDGLQPYFFRLADHLIKLADIGNLRVIMSERAYYYWKGCELVYGDMAVGYRARNRIKICNSRYEALKALLGLQPYFNLPEMYTTSLFHRDIINKTKKKQQGQVFVTHPQDANLAAIACSLENNYLMSFIPLGWVGSSLNSAGMAVSCTDLSMEPTENYSDLYSLQKDYVDKVNHSKLEYHYLAGDFKLGNLSIYFWQSLLQTQHLRSTLENKIIISNIFKFILFCVVLNEIKHLDKTDLQLPMFKEILKRNKCSYFMINVGSKVSYPLIGITHLIIRVVQKICQICSNQIVYFVTWSEDPNMNLDKASNYVQTLILKKKWF